MIIDFALFVLHYIPYVRVIKIEPIRGCFNVNRTNTLTTSHNVYYVNSKVGEVMEKRLRSLEDDISDLRNAIDVLENLIIITENDEMLDTIYRTKANLKILVYDLEEFVQCD